MLHLMNKIILKPGKDRSVFRYHPWIFSGAIAKTEGKLQEGDLVRVYSSDITRSVRSQSEFSLLKMKKSVILFGYNELQQPITCAELSV